MASVENDSDEIFEDEAAQDPLFVPDDDEDDDVNVNEEISDDDYRPVKTKSRRQQSKSAKKSPKKRGTKKTASQSSRRSSRTKSRDFSYCEDSSDEEEAFELCDGQPSKVKAKKSPKQLPIKKQKKSAPKQKSSRSKKSHEEEDDYVSETVANSSRRLRKNSTDTSRTLRTARPQVSYVEASSEDDLDQEEYEICDGQPVKCTDLPKMHQSSKSGKANEQKAIVLDDSELSKDKVMLVKGQPVFRNKALSIPLKDVGKFYVQKPMLDEMPDEPLYIWRLQGKIMQKFVQLNVSKVFESTRSYIGFDNTSEGINVPIIASLFLKNEAQELYLAEVTDCPENKELLRVINNRAQISDEKSHKAKKKSATKKNDIAPTKATKRGNGTRTSVQDDSPVPCKRGRPMNATSSSKRIDESSELDEVKANYPHYLKMIVAASLSKSVLQDLPEQDFMKMSVVDNMLSSLGDRLLEKAKFDSELLNNLNRYPVLEYSEVNGQLNVPSETSKITSNTQAVFSGDDYDPKTLLEIGEKVGERRTSFISNQARTLMCTYHQLRHYKLHLLEKCKKKVKASGNHCRGETDSNSHTHEIKSVSQTLDSILDVVQSSPDVDVVMLEARSVLNDIINNVVLNVQTQTPVEQCLKDEKWIGEMFEDLKAIILKANDLLKS